MEKEIILSICIPTYNRKEIVKKLVLEILRSKRDDIEIVILDNASTDGTYEALKKIEDFRLKIYFNKIGIPAMENGIKALKLSQGKYCMLFNDREIAKNQYLDELVEFLKKDEYSFIYVSPKNPKNKQIKIFDKGIVAKRNINHRGYHPTGLTFNTRILKKIKTEDYLDYNKVNYYSNFFIVYDIVKYEKMAIYPSDFWEHAPEEIKIKRKSGYTDLTKPPYFTPESKIDRLFKFSNHILSDNEITEKEKTELLLRVFSRIYYNATCIYVYYNSQNKYECYHYGIEPKILNFNNYLKISKKFREDYIKYLKSKNYNIDFQMRLGIYIASLKSLLGVGKQKIKKLLGR